MITIAFIAKNIFQLTLFTKGFETVKEGKVNQISVEIDLR